MRGLNSIILIGHAGHDPELRHTPNGRTLCNLRIATKRATRQGEAWVDVTDWHRVTLWEKDADICAQYVKKGRLVGVEGELRTETWTDASGEKRSRVVVHGKRLHLMGGKATEDSPRPSHSAERVHPAFAAAPDADMQGIPF